MRMRPKIGASILPTETLARCPMPLAPHAQSSMFPQRRDAEHEVVYRASCTFKQHQAPQLACVCLVVQPQQPLGLVVREVRQHSLRENRVSVPCEGIDVAQTQDVDVYLPARCGNGEQCVAGVEAQCRIYAVNRQAVRSLPQQRYGPARPDTLCEIFHDLLGDGALGCHRRGFGTGGALSINICCRTFVSDLSHGPGVPEGVDDFLDLGIGGALCTNTPKNHCVPQGSAMAIKRTKRRNPQAPANST
mmetsp:Transcript_124045/g.358743  ORF Transcript_124045/g.358743 Transcript_124045/m.358743 type:complete len:247 (+) Transcript_124045:97-837(+)